MNGIRSQVKKSARQMAGEPFEVLKKAPGQVLGLPAKEIKQETFRDSDNQKKKEENTQKEKLDREKSRRLSTALSAELREIQRQKLFEQLIKKVSEGEMVNLEDYRELSIEQKQVLIAQMEALEARSLKKQKASLPEPTTKPKRNLFAGAKTQLERMKRKSEIRMPPSG